MHESEQPCGASVMGEESALSDESGLVDESGQALAALLVLGQLDAFSSMVADARHAPDLAVRGQWTTLALAHYAPVGELMASLGDDSTTATIWQSLEAFHRYSPVTSWPQALVKATVTSGMALDLLPLVPDEAPLPPGLNLDDLATRHQAVVSFGEAAIADLVADNPQAHALLALFGRRLVGEATAQAQRVAGRASALLGLLTGQEPGSVAELEHTSVLIGALGEASAQRLERLGLQP